MNSEHDHQNVTGVDAEEARVESAPEAAEQERAGFCRECGRPLTAAEVRYSQGTIYCAEHFPGPGARSEWDAPPPPPVADAGASPGLAFVLGLIPGVGAIYNGQYAKGLIHVVVFGMLISIISGGGSGGLEPLFGVLIPAWIFYMAFEASHTAKKRQSGEVVDEFSSLIPIKSEAGSPTGPIILIVLGGLFLLLTLDLIELYQVARFWPILLILVGIWMLLSRRRNSLDVGD